MTKRVDHDVTDRTVLVTGGAGFVGHHLVEALLPDNDVHVLDNLSTGSRAVVPDEATLHLGDVRDESDLAAAMADVDLVFHQAAQVSVPLSVEEPVATARTNATGTAAVLEAARRADARVVIASSAAVYGQPETVPIDEEHPTDPRSPYGLSKLAAEQYAELYADLYGLETVALRYFNVYGPDGPGEPGDVVEIFLDQARRGDPITVTGDGEQTRDLVHVRDVVQANLLAGTADVAGEVFNVGTGEAVTISTLAARIRAMTGSNSPIEHVDAREGDLRRSCADVTAARERLGYEPAVSFEEGLASMVEAPTVDG